MGKFDAAAAYCARRRIETALGRVQSVLRYRELYPDDGGELCSEELMRLIEGELKHAIGVLSDELERYETREPWIPPCGDSNA